MLFSKRKHQGQALITIVIFALVLFMFMGLAIDGGALYVQRRHLQNVADAACLSASTALGLGKTVDEAKADANQYIIDNLGESAEVALVLPSTIDFTTGLVGTGTSLTRGIEIANDGTSTAPVYRAVRVAVTFPAYTYFMRLGGIDTYDVVGRAHCSPIEGGGVLPIAIVRVPGYDQDSPCDPDARIGIADPGSTLPQLNGNGPDYVIVRDILQKVGSQAVKDCGGDSTGVAGTVNSGTNATSTVAGGSVLNDGSTPVSNNCSGGIKRNWFDWPSLGSPSAGTGPFRAPCDAAGMPNNVNNWKITKSGNTLSIPFDANAGYPLKIAGNEAYPNVGNISFTGPVLLDLRNIGGSTVGGAGPLYFNGMTGATSTNAWKDSIAKYIRTQYPGPDVEIGQDLSIVNGVNTGSILDALDDRFIGGEIVTALIYNGVHYENPNYSLNVVCKAGTLNCAPIVSEPKLTERNNPGAVNAACEYDGNGFIGSTSFSGYPTNHQGTAPSPATYTVSLTPDPIRVTSNAAAATIELTARISGPTSSDLSLSGGSEGWGKTRVRWTSSAGSTGWQLPGTPTAVSMPLVDGNGDGNWDAANVTLEVIQTETEDCTIVATGTTVQVPKQVRGSQTIQVIGRSTSTSIYHSDYGKIGLKDYPASDYFFSYASDPNAILVEGTAKTIRSELQVQDAASKDILKWQGSDESRFTSWASASSCTVQWFKGTTSLGSFACGSGPTGFTASLVDGPSNSPTLQLAYNGTASVAGDYSLDLQLTETSGRVHSSRFFLKIETELSNSINSWVTAVCYANIQIMTDLNQSSTPNEVWARPVSGCINKNTVSSGLTSRLVPWQ